MQRQILLHHHIFKNAGTTIDWTLRNNFGNAFYEYDELQARGHLTETRLLHFLAGNPQIRAISSHTLPLARDTDNFVFHDILFLRHPIARLSSIYNYYRRLDPSDDELVHQAQTLELHDFVQLLVSEHPNQVNSPQLTISLRGGKYGCPPGREELVEGIKIVKSAAIIGIVRRFDDALISAEYFLHPAFGDIDFAYIRQNYTIHRKERLEDRIEKFRKACGESLYDQVVKMNALDFALLDEAEKEIERRLELIPDLAERRRDFSERCKRLQDLSAGGG